MRETTVSFGLTGSAFAAYRYDPWGSPLASGATTQGTNLVTSTLAGEIASRQILRYAGYAYDAESGLYYCSARYYDPATRQWTTGDPAKADGEESVYQYCEGCPATSRDPSGLKRLSVLRVKQPTGSSWCWAACGRSVIRWYFPKSKKKRKVTQRVFAEYVFGKDVTDEQTADEDDLGKGLFHWDVGYNWRYTSSLSLDSVWTKVKDRVNAGNPMIFGTKAPGYEHFWVVCGYKKDSGVRQLWVMDPTNGQYRKFGLKYFVDTYQLQTLMYTSKQVH